MHKMTLLSSMVLSLLCLAPYGFADEGTTQGTANTDKGEWCRLEGAIRPHHRKDLLGIDDDRFDLHTQAP